MSRKGDFAKKCKMMPQNGPAFEYLWAIKMWNHLKYPVYQQTFFQFVMDKEKSQLKYLFINPVPSLKCNGWHFSPQCNHVDDTDYNCKKWTFVTLILCKDHSFSLQDNYPVLHAYLFSLTKINYPLWLSHNMQKRRLIELGSKEIALFAIVVGIYR